MSNTVDILQEAGTAYFLRGHGCTHGLFGFFMGFLCVGGGRMGVLY
jgi:hypothetical protein